MILPDRCEPNLSTLCGNTNVFTPTYKTTFVITTDHGRGTEPINTWRSHGTDIKGADEIWIAVLGPDTPALGEVNGCKQLYQNQVAKTAARF